MKKVILARYGEIALKGLNRPAFEMKLSENIKKSLEGLGRISVLRSQSRIFIEPEAEGYNFDEALSRLTKVFGIVSVSIALKIPPDFSEIEKHSLELARKHADRLVGKRAVKFPAGYSAKLAGRHIAESDGKHAAIPGGNQENGCMAQRGVVSFKVEAKRGDKNFPLKSPEISARLGGYLLENVPLLRVDVHDPDFIFYVEVRESAYIYCDITPACGGLPVGTSGKALLLLSGGIDSPVAGWMMAKRGMEIEAVHFHSYPYTSERARDKVVELARILSRYCFHVRLHVVPFTEIQLEIGDKCPEEYLTIIMRRAMMRIAEKIAAGNGAQALVTGESLGQVASQTVHSLAVTNAVVKMPVFRPLIGMDKNEVVEIARKIGTFKTSILPYEDCCTVFVAKHPSLRPRIENAERFEAGLRLEEMMENAINNSDIMVVSE